MVTQTAAKKNLKKGGEVAVDPEIEAMREMYAQTFKEFKENSIVKGTILDIRNSEVVVDIGYKSEGAIPVSEFLDISEFKPGSQIEVLIEQLEDNDGMIVLSKQKADKMQSWERIISECGEGKLVKGKIVRKVKGGMIVDIGCEAFLPASQIAMKPVRNLDDLIGQIYEFKVVKINNERKNIVVSRKQFLEETLSKDKAKLLTELRIGDSRAGTVKNITDFGVFIDLNGIDGLLHITDMTWGRISHPSEMVAIGDAIEVVILDIDKEKERVSLGLKQKTPNPWDDVEKKYAVGTKIKGRVVNIMPYGVFVELEKGIEGLIHISELSWTKRINHPSEILAIGDIVEAMVLNIEKDAKKISLGIKQTEANPWTTVEEKFPVGTKIAGKIRNITSYGAFVELEEGIDGLIHISDISWTKKINHPSEYLKKGDKVDAIVLSVDQKNKKISLGLKQLEPDPWDKIEQEYKIGTIVTGKVNKVTGFGAFVELNYGFEGLVHVSQLSGSDDNMPVNAENIVKEGQELTAMVIKVDPPERKIALSVKEYMKYKKDTEGR